MRFSDKGPIIPAPVLDRDAEAVSREVRSWPRVISATR